ncbi:MAG: DUF2950 domain-containing protein [Acidobacteriaceae bacterium]|nr:DUF2950 domain-containing protein [Acidobacteriaceae bacterium]
MRLAMRPQTFTTWLLLPALIILLAACRKSNEASVKEASAAVFASPDEASNALLAAAKSGDRNALLQIFGPSSGEIIFSGDPVQDKSIAQRFAAGYEQMHRWRKMTDGSQVLMVGVDNFPFPIPLKKNGDGKWFFDTAAGKDEILSRRIGRNELAIIDACRAIADAQAEHFSQLHDGDGTKQYAMKFISDPGKQNGLYWKSPEGQPESPLGPLAAFATSEGYSGKPTSHTPFHGYYFHMLKGQSDKAQGGAKDYVVNGKMTGGFAFVAYPAEYGNSGVMTFIINQDGVLFQKDLGKTTAETATAMSKFDPDGWTPVD